MFRNLFGPKGPTGDDVAAINSIRQDFGRLLINPTPQDLQGALESWDWIKPPASAPLFVSAFGDLFFQGPRAILMLDTLDGALRSVASNGADLRRRLHDEVVQDELLNSVWIQAAHRQGLYLSDGECFDWKVAPALGGPIASDAIHKMSFVIKVNLAGQLHRQIKALPPGARINRVTISE